MPPFDYIVIPVALLFAALASWGDLGPMLPYVLGRTGYSGAMHGRIPNRLLLFWLAFGVAAVGLSWAYTAGGGRFLGAEWVEATEGISYWLAVLINSLLSFVLGVTLWLLGLWAAGDAKMFALLAFTLPLSSYSDNYLSYFPSFALFFNTFIAMFIILLVEFIVQVTLVAGRSKGRIVPEKMGALWAAAKEKKLLVLKLVIFFLALFTVVRIMRHFVREGLDQFMEMNKTIIYCILFLMFRPLMRLAQKPWAFTVAILIIVGYGVYAFFFDPTGEAKWEFINIGWLAASIIIFRFMYDAYLKATDELEIPLEELRRGMILGDSTLASFVERKQFFKERVGALAPDGLSELQVAAIREWYGENNPDGLVSVARTIPFAPALFVGALLTVVFSGLVFVF